MSATPIASAPLGKRHLSPDPEKIFGVTPDFEDFFDQGPYAFAFASLVKAIESGRGFMALTGEPGTGKTTVLFKLLEHYRDTAHTVFIYQTQCSARELVRLILADSSLESSSDVVRMQRDLNELLATVHNASKRFIVIVDEAHNLQHDALEALRLLSDFETPKEKLLQIILAGQPGLEKKLAAPAQAQLLQRISTFCRLRTLTAAESAAYVTHRWRSAAPRTPMPFTHGALSAIFERSGGIPRAIHHLCFDLLCLARSREVNQIDAHMVNEISGSGEWVSAEPDGPVSPPLSVMCEAPAEEYEQPTQRVADGSGRGVQPPVIPEMKPILAPMPMTQVVHEEVERSTPAALASASVWMRPANGTAVAAQPAHFESTVKHEPAANPADEFIAAMRKRTEHEYGRGGKHGASETKLSPPQAANTRMIIIGTVALLVFSTLAPMAWRYASEAGFSFAAPTTVRASDASSSATAKPPITVLPVRASTRTVHRGAVASHPREKTQLADDPNAPVISTAPASSPVRLIGSASVAPPLPELRTGHVGGGLPEIVVSPEMPKYAEQQIHSGGTVLVKPNPAYPSVARLRQIEGDVVLSAVIDKEGKLQNVQAISGHPLLVPAAISAAKAMRYTPYRIGNTPTEATTQVTFQFSLSGREK